MIIRLDPRELEVLSEVVRGCAVTLQEIGGSLPASVVSPFPPDLHAATMAVVRSVVDALHRVAGEMGPMATDLQRRAAIAATDLNAAVSVVSPTSATTGVGQSIIPMTVAMPGAPTLPGDPIVTMTVPTSHASTSTLGSERVSTPISTSLTPTGVPGVQNSISMITFAPPFELTRIPGAPSSQEAQLALIRAGATGSAAAVNLGSGASAFNHHHTVSWMAEPRFQMEGRLGYLLSTQEYHRREPRAAPFFSHGWY